MQCDSPEVAPIRAGAVRMALELDVERRIESVEFAIGDESSGDLSVTGTTPVAARARTIRAFVGDLVATSPQRLVAVAVDPEGSVVCGGIAIFNLADGEVTDVPVPVWCGWANGGGATTGRLEIDIYSCPAITNVTAIPAVGSPRIPIELTGAAIDPGGGPVEYRWSVDAGRLEGADRRRAWFHCACPPDRVECTNAVSLIVENSTGCSVTHQMELRCKA